MKLKNLIFEEAYGFMKALGKITEQDLSIDIAYRLQKLLDEVQSKSHAYKELKVKLFKKYGKDMGDGIFTLPVDHMEAWKKFNELVAMEEEYNIKKVVLSSSSGVRISAKDLSLLKDIIEVK